MIGDLKKSFRSCQEKEVPVCALCWIRLKTEELRKVSRRGCHREWRRDLRRAASKGLEQGKMEGMTQIYYTEMNYSADQIAKKLDAPVDVIQQLIDSILKK